MEVVVLSGITSTFTFILSILSIPTIPTILVIAVPGDGAGGGILISARS